MTRWQLVVPVKGGAGKSRLTEVDPAVRSSLALAFALDTVRAAAAARHVVEVLAVTDDPLLTAALAVLSPGRVRVVPERAAGGLGPAIRRGLTEVVPGEPVAVLLGDLPALTAAALDEGLALADAVPRALVPDAGGDGTTLLTGRDGVLTPRFGTDSRAAHVAAGHVVLDVAASSPLRRDVDTWADLEAAVALGLGPATARALAQIDRAG